MVRSKYVWMGILAGSSLAGSRGIIMLVLSWATSTFQTANWCDGLIPVGHAHMLVAMPGGELSVGLTAWAPVGVDAYELV